jgi:hypothetical protein
MKDLLIGILAMLFGGALGIIIPYVIITIAQKPRKEKRSKGERA